MKWHPIAKHCYKHLHYLEQLRQAQEKVGDPRY